MDKEVQSSLWGELELIMSSIPTKTPTFAPTIKMSPQKVVVRLNQKICGSTNPGDMARDQADETKSLQKLDV